MVAKKLSKNEAKEKIEKFFLNIKSKEPKEIHKIKRLASKNRISLKEEKKLFCNNCLEPFVSPKIRISGGHKTITCSKCGKVKRIKLGIC